MGMIMFLIAPVFLWLVLFHEPNYRKFFAAYYLIGAGIGLLVLPMVFVRLQSNPFDIEVYLTLFTYILFVTLLILGFAKPKLHYGVMVMIVSICAWLMYGEHKEKLIRDEIEKEVALYRKANPEASKPSESNAKSSSDSVDAKKAQ